MTLRHLSIFRKVCNSDCNLTKTAGLLHMTQPAVSLAIKELEEYYGVRLFDRMGRKLQITDAGQHFLQYATNITNLFADMENEIRDWGERGVMRAGASITIGSQFMPSYVSAFSAVCPGIDIRVTIEQPDRLEQKLIDNKLDFALTEDIPKNRNIVSEAYMEDRLSVVCAAGKGWKQGQIISQEEFARQRFLLPEHGSSTREVFERVVGQAGIHVDPAWEAMSTIALVNAAVMGLGIAVLPHRMILPALFSGKIVTVSVKDLVFSRFFYIIYHKDKYRTESVNRFLSMCRNYESDYPLPDYSWLN